MENIKPYSKYKPSGISWLGDVPEHWNIKRIKYVFKEQDKRSEIGSEDLLSVSHYTGVTKKSDKVVNGDFMTNAKTLVGYKIVEKGDLVINIMLAWNGSLGISKFDGITSPAYCVYKSLIGGEKYFGYLFRTKNAQQEFKKQSTGIIDSRLRLYTDKFFNIKTVIPSLEEQTAIANFLDYKTAKIDRFIRKKKQLIKLLNEQKAGIINHAVTKGLNPNTTMKASDIKWLGEIPEHWEVMKLKYVAEILRGKFTPRPRNDPKYYDGQYPFIQTGNVATADKYIETYNQTLNDFGYEVSKEFPVNSVVMTIAANIADVAILKFNACFPDSIIGFKPFDNIDVEFLYYQLKNLRPEFFRIAIKSTQYNLNVERVQSVFIVLPSIHEQTAIVSHIEKETAIITKTIATIEKEIVLTQEYRTALIAEAVTGKIDVRAFVTPTISPQEELYEEIEEELDMVAEDAESYENE